MERSQPWNAAKADTLHSWRITSRETTPFCPHPNERRTCTRPRAQVRQRATRRAHKLLWAQSPGPPKKGGCLLSLTTRRTAGRLARSLTSPDDARRGSAHAWITHLRHFHKRIEHLAAGRERIAPSFVESVGPFRADFRYRQVSVDLSTQTGFPNRFPTRRSGAVAWLAPP